MVDRETRFREIESKLQALKQRMPSAVTNKLETSLEALRGQMQRKNESRIPRSELRQLKSDLVVLQKDLNHMELMQLGEILAEAGILVDFDQEEVEVDLDTATPKVIRQLQQFAATAKRHQEYFSVTPEGLSGSE